MHKKRMLTFIWVLAACMLVLVCYFIFRVETPLRDHIIFSETVHGLTIEPYYDETDDMYYLFLPAYVSEGDIQIKRDGFVQVNFADDNIDYGNSLGEVPLCEDVTLTIKNFGRIETYTYQIWQSENLPTIYLETESGSLDYVNEDKENEEQASVVMINADGSVEYNGITDITGRGHSTWLQDKKPYNLNFSVNISVWNFEDVSKLCLLANYYDYSSMRNAIVYYAAREQRVPYTSECQFVDLYANGNYMGLYVVATKQEYKKHIEEDGIVAVFELSTYADSDDVFVSEYGTPVEVIYGSKAYVQDEINEFENALFNYDYDTAYEYIDLESFARMLVLNEFFVNFDNCFFSSQYFYIDTSGIMHTMCAWDYDLTFGFNSGTNFFNNRAVNEITTYFAYHRNGKYWYEYMIHDETFCDCLIKILNNNYDRNFCNQLDQFMISCISYIDSSWKCNNIRWKQILPVNQSGYESLEDFYDIYSNLINTRTNFLIDYFTNQESYCLVRFLSDSPYIKTNLCIPYGEKLSDYLYDYNIMNETCGNYTLLDWETEDGVSVYDIDTVTEDLTFNGVWEELTILGNVINESEEQVIEETLIRETISDSSTDGSIIQLLKKVYHFFGLESFDRKALIIGAVFVLILLGMFIEEMIRANKNRR